MILQIKEQMKTQHQKTDMTHGTHPGIGFKIALKASNKLTHDFSRNFSLQIKPQESKKKI
jgi:hypothetical protein